MDAIGRGVMDELDLPEPSAELVLMRELVAWYLDMLPRKTRLEAIDELNRRMEAVGAEEKLVVLRPAKKRGSVLHARRLASNWWRAAFGARVV